MSAVFARILRTLSAVALLHLLRLVLVLLVPAVSAKIQVLHLAVVVLMFEDFALEVPPFNAVKKAALHQVEEVPVQHLRTRNGTVQILPVLPQSHPAVLSPGMHALNLLHDRLLPLDISRDFLRVQGKAPSLPTATKAKRTTCVGLLRVKG